MARIVFGAAGEGFGHSSRAQIIGRRLIDAGHEVIFVASNKALEYLSAYFPGLVKPVFGLTFAYRNRQISSLGTVVKNVMGIGEMMRINSELFGKHLRDFNPDVVISDFEPFTAHWAKIRGIPFVSVDNEHVLTHCEIEHVKGALFSRLSGYVITRAYYWAAQAYVVISFFRVKPTGKNVFIVPPVVRSEVLANTPSSGDYIVYYSTAATQKEQITEIFRKYPSQKFYIYGFNEDSQEGNCIFKKRSTEGFLKDMAGARGVIASGGFTVISECLYYRKKMLLLPYDGQYEQMINGKYLEDLGIGLNRKEINEQPLDEYLKLLEQPQMSDDRIIYPDNEEFFRIFGDVLSRLPKPIDLNCKNLEPLNEELKFIK